MLKLRIPRWIVVIALAGLVESILLLIWVGSLPYRVTITPEIRDVAIEMRRTIIELDGVLIGFAGLIGTMIFTRPIGSDRDKREALQTTLAMVLMSVCLLLVSAFLAIHSLSSIFSQSAFLVDLRFLMSATLLVLGVDAMGITIAAGAYPPHRG